MKICLAASSGGHLTELLRISDVWKGRRHFFVTTKKTALDFLGRNAKTYSVGWGNRKHPYLLLKMLTQCIEIVLRERPDIVISTGAAVGCITGLLVKLLGGKIIWIDTISHIENLSMSGRIIRPFTDLFFVQWPELRKRYPRVIYLGSVI